MRIINAMVANAQDTLDMRDACKAAQDLVNNAENDSLMDDADEHQGLGIFEKPDGPSGASSSHTERVLWRRQ